MINLHVVPKAAAAGAIPDVRASGTLNPDRSERLSYLAVLEAHAGRVADARRTVAKLVRVEPKNPEAWALLAVLTRTSDPALSARAQARVDDLDPRNSVRPPGG